MDTQDEVAEIRKVSLDYIKGLQKNDFDLLDKVFHPDACIAVELRGEVIVKRIADTMIPYMKNSEPVAVHSPRYRGHLVSVTQHGPIATVVLDEQEMQGADFTTYLQLHRIGGNWKITAKITHATPRNDA